MALPAPDRNASRSPNGLSLNFNSKNPFRNRATSPAPGSATSPSFPPVNMQSRNPFLDPSESGVKSNTANGNGVALADDIFKDLSLLDKPATIGAPQSRGVPDKSGATVQHRAIPSDDRRERTRPPRLMDSPPKRAEHQRRASESSITEKERRDRYDRNRDDRPPRTESEERRRRERRKEREERHRREKEKIRNGGKSGKPQRNLDIIDKLDVTGIYGQGLFHHDGPFDACNPHRNVKKDRRAPMQAFPEGSMNMALGGAGPLRSRLDLDKFHGRGEEGFQDFGATRKATTATLINPHDKTEQVHGEESYGLGTSTFLEGAPASRSALQRRESEEPSAQESNGFGGGLQRKKSLAQRLRGMSNSRRGPGELRSPEARYNDMEISPPQQSNKAVSAGGPSRAYAKENEVNVFDNEYDAAFDKKGAQIRIAEQERPNVGRARAPSSPGKPQNLGLVRSVTADSAAVRSSGEEEKVSTGGGGFLNRMKSLKGGGRRARPERKDSGS